MFLRKEDKYKIDEMKERIRIIEKYELLLSRNGCFKHINTESK